MKAEKQDVGGAGRGQELEVVQLQSWIFGGL